jgi:N-acetylglucosamine-6-phosphate deacetylase
LTRPPGLAGQPASAGTVIIAAPRIVPAAGRSRTLAPGYLVIAAGRISELGQGRPPRPPDEDLPDGLLLPGLVDLQVNGYFGEELMAVRPPGWAAVAQRLPETGTTAFLPTFITAPLGELAASLRAAAAIVTGLPRGGAKVLGVHLEGPFISPLRSGAHDREWIIAPSAEAVDELILAGAGILRLVTLAPERDGALAAVRRFAQAGPVVSVGHSDATAAQVGAAADAGARMVTHLFDAQRGLHHREPGVVGQALTDRRLTSGLIADLHHVGGAACAIAFAAAPGRICLVTDAAACAGMPPGEYLLGGAAIELPAGNGVPPVRPDGTLAGSALRMDAAIANMVRAGIALPAAVAAASRVPADLVGRTDIGRIAPGARADLVWLGDDLRAKATWIDGERVYPSAGTVAAGTLAAGTLAAGTLAAGTLAAGTL